MKKTLLVISSILVLSFTAMAQDFFPGWYVGVKGGATMSVGESEWTNLLSPSAAVSAGYQFSPVFGLRGELSGWQAKGALSTTNYVYKFNDAQLAIDGTFDLASLFAGYKERTFNPYVLVGVGGNARFNNDDLLANKAGLPAENHLWEGSVIGLVGRAGAGVDIRLSDAVAIAVEVVENMHSDKFNSKVGDALDHQIDAQVGLKFNFGAAKKKAAAAAAAAAAAEAEAARLAAEKAAAEAAAKAAAEAEAARLAAEKAAAEKAAAERAAAERAAAERAAARQTTENVLFIIGQTNVRPSEQGKIDNIVALMNKYPEAKVTVSGYADKQTGYAKWNMTLSQRRAEAVKKALVEAGIAEDRITTEYYGSEVNPFSTPAANRVAVCVTR